MELTEAQYERIAPLQRRNVTLANLQVMNALLYVASVHSLQAAQPLGQAGRAGAHLGRADARARSGRAGWPPPRWAARSSSCTGRGGSAEKGPRAIARSHDNRSALTLSLSQASDRRPARRCSSATARVRTGRPC